MENFVAITEVIKNVVWSNILVILLMGAGIYFSIRLKFPQLRFFKEMIRVLKGNGDTSDGITPFQAFATALARCSFLDLGLWILCHLYGFV